MKHTEEAAIDKEQDAEAFFAEPLKLPRLKKAKLRADEGYLPHIVFDQNLKRWILKIDNT